MRMYEMACMNMQGNKIETAAGAQEVGQMVHESTPTHTSKEVRTGMRTRVCMYVQMHERGNSEKGNVGCPNARVFCPCAVSLGQTHRKVNEQNQNTLQYTHVCIHTAYSCCMYTSEDVL